MLLVVPVTVIVSPSVNPAKLTPLLAIVLAELLKVRSLAVAFAEKLPSVSFRVFIFLDLSHCAVLRF